MVDIPQCRELYYHKIFAHLLFQLKDIVVEQQKKVSSSFRSNGLFAQNLLTRLNMNISEGIIYINNQRVYRDVFDAVLVIFSNHTFLE